MRRIRYLPPLVVALVLLAAATPAQAQNKTLYWDGWDTLLQILPNGDLRVVERQRINFTNGSFTFGFREIPLAQTDGISQISVSEPGVGVYNESSTKAPFTFETGRSGDDLSIRWYFPPTENATRTFDIAYTVHNALRIYDAGDKLQWKAIATDRDFPIREASVRVVLPPGAQFQIIDSAGVPATWGQSPDGSSVTFIAKEQMSPSDSMEVGIEFSHGFIPKSEPGWQQSFDAENAYKENVKPFVDFGLGLLAAALILGGPALVYLVWYMRGRDPIVGPVPEYVSEPPDDLPPGVLGTLIDEKADMRDIVATIADLGRKGALKIEETEKKGWLGLGSADFTFDKTNGHSVALNAVESEIMSGIFTGGKSSVGMSALRNKFYTRLPKIQSKLYKEMVDRKLFRANPDSTRKLWRGMGLALIGFGIGSGICLGSAFAGVTSALPWLSGGLVVSGIAVLIAGGRMPAKTRKGSESAAKWKAFKAYLQRIDKIEDLKTVGELFERYLPYAIALGVRESYVRKFAQEATTPVPTWWVPYGYPYRGSGGRRTETTSTGPGAPRGPGGLQDMSDSMSGGLQSMSDGLTRMLNSTGRVLRSAPSSSGRSGGGFSSGGFSAGGGGGGGSAGFG